MDNLTSKYIIFAVGLFITIIVSTMLFSTYGEVKGIYEGVSETNISIKDLYDDIHIQYHGTQQNGVDLVNTLKKYEGERYIEVKYPNPIQENVVVFSGNRTEREVDILYELMKQDNSAGTINEDFKNDYGYEFPYSYSSKFDVSVEKNGSKTIIEFVYIP